MKRCCVNPSSWEHSAEYRTAWKTKVTTGRQHLETCISDLQTRRQRRKENKPNPATFHLFVVSATDRACPTLARSIMQEAAKVDNVKAVLAVCQDARAIVVVVIAVGLCQKAVSG